MGSAQREFSPNENLNQADEKVRPSLLQEEVARKLEAHRRRRKRATAAPVLAAQTGAPSLFSEDSESLEDTPKPRNAIAAAVAERYAQTPSYRAFLAEEAQRAAHQAAAAAEIAARNAVAAAAVQQELLAELALWTEPQEFSHETAITTKPTPRHENRQQAATAAEATPSPAPASYRTGLTVRLYEEATLARTAQTTALAPRAVSHEEAGALDALDEEIAFRQAPVFEEYSIEPPTPLPANLLEFPRQLVAPKKARPRLAEGPLRDDAPRSPQLRIFEVEAEQISTAPAPLPAAPEWTSIRLDAQSSVTEPAAVNERLTPMPALVAPQAAPISLRLMAALVDAGLVIGVFFGCVAGVARLAGSVPTGIEAAGESAAALAVLYVGYYLLFFTLADQTPGMRYARIGLCTLSDENPSRSAMRKRLLALAIAALPLGLGLLWAFLDEDGLGWHDRLSGMYPRAY
jgi:uncharacterized RDD family membrane protein YckC